MKRYGLLGVLIALVLTACGGGGVKSPDFEAQLQTLTVSPNPASVGNGETLQFTATGTYSTPPGQGNNDDMRDITKIVKWTSSDSSVATIDENGLATGVGAGATTITAEKDGIKVPITLTGEGLALRSLVVTTPQAGVAPGGSTTYTAQGKYSDGTIKDVTDAVIDWTLDPATLGTFSPDTGKTVTLTAGLQTGLGTVTATVRGTDITGTAQFGVGQLSTISIDPTTDTQPQGRPSTAFTSTGHYTLQTGSSDSFDLPVSATWTAVNAAGTTGTAPSLDTSCDAKASTTCQVTGNTVGTVTITATFATLTATATLTVTDPVLDSIQITPDAVDADPRTTPDSDSLPKGSSQTYYALYYYTDALGTPLSSPRTDAEKVVWTTTGTAGVVTIAAGADNSIVATAAAEGTGANLVATSGTLTDSVALTVTPATVTRLLSVRPTIAYVGIGRQKEFTAVGKYSTGDTADIADGLVTWSSADPSIATIDSNTGVATAGNDVNTDGVTITATLVSDSSQKATATLVVTPDVCTTPLLAADGAVATAGPAPGICLLCGVSNPERVVDTDLTNAGTITVGVGALDASRSIDVNTSINAPYVTPFAAGSRPAFIITNPTGPLVLAQVLSQLQMSTLMNGNVQESTSDIVPLRLDLLGLELINLNQTQALVSFPTSLPYNGLRIALKSGTATALSAINVVAACGTSEPPVQAASGIQSIGTAGVSDSDKPMLEVGASKTFVAHDYATDAELNSDDVVWSSSDESKATVSAAGVVTGVAAGNATITATLKDTSICGSHCTAIRDITVTAAICEIPLEATTQSATIDSVLSGLCLTCSTRDLGNVIDAHPETYGSVFLPVALLNASVTVTASAKPPFVFPAGQTAGFVAASPGGKVLTAEIASSITIQTLLGGELTGDSSATTTPLRLDLLGASAVGSIGTSAAPLFITTTKDYDAVQITFTSGLATALSSYNLYTACAKGPQ